MLRGGLRPAAPMGSPKLTPSPNFAYLAHHDAKLVMLASQAEAQFAEHPVATLVTLRLFAELLAMHALAKLGRFVDTSEPQQQRVERLVDCNAIGAQQRAIFHELRRAGNAAAHEYAGDHNTALHQLRMARELALWFQRAFGNNKKFDPGPFVPPPEPQKPEPGLHDELARLQKEREKDKAALEAATRALEQVRREAEAAAASRMTAEERARKAAEDVAIMEALVAEQTSAHAETAAAEAARARAALAQVAKLQAELAAVQTAAAAAPPAEIAATLLRAKQASDAIQLDEQATRMLIDGQLRAAGWEADSKALTFAAGVRPQRGKNLAIAEWPTQQAGKAGRADYVLFAGLTAIAVVEAKRKHKDIVGVIPQAKRYSAGYLVQGDESFPEGSPWGAYRIPFVFATNGRPFLRQLIDKSGVWFLDARRAQNHPVPLEGWYTPEGLIDLLKQDLDRAHAALEVEPMPYIDRDYQRRAILAVESALKDGKREMLLAMATGTGKTRTCIGLCYRLLKTRRFRRVLFVVDRNALARQTADAFKELRLEQLQTFTDIFGVKEMADLQVDRDTRLHVATIQAMVQRVLGPHDDASEANIPPVDQYDCIVVDECHRGYLLDRDLSDRELLLRDEADYISKYRRVLDHFDAVKIGLTATPALHTTEIFGKPVFTYAYREAVIDGFLVDHDPPVRIITQLAQDGIHFKAHEEVLVLDRTQQLTLPEVLPDDVDFEVEDFNRRVLTEDFTRAVLEEVARHIDPSLPDKTLLFCVDDHHADTAVRLLKDALAKQWGEVDDDAVAKITGASDQPLQLIRRFRNERLPSFGVTVDLLTTGIDVPTISNLVFLRRVRSRILYEQMLGRATRLCPDIGKERFRIFDAVDLYKGLQDVSTMKPVVVNPFVSFAQLVHEIVSAADEDHRREALSELVAKLQRKKRLLSGEAQERFETAAGCSFADVVRVLRGDDLAAAKSLLARRTDLAPFLDVVAPSTPYRPPVSNQPDSVREVLRGYGEHKRPEDYLESFRRFLTDNMNLLPALKAVVTRPRELTRAHLKELKLALDQKGFTEAYLQTAFRDAKNEDIAASIIGFIRQAALGAPLVPYAERVDHAVRRFQAKHKLSDPQRTWLQRIANQLKAETIVDRDALDRGQFAAQGGFTRINKTFDGKLEAVLGELADEVWSDAG
jgi:type I restriction enzyme R subunit